MFHVQYLFLVIKIYFCIRHDERKKKHYFVVVVVQKKMSIAPICVKTQKAPKHRKQVLTV